jgi:hypothetical protein
MKTLIQKEMRENFKLAVIGFVVLSALLFWAFHKDLAWLDTVIDNQWQQRDNFLQPLLSMWVLLPLELFCGLYGAGLGWAQARAEGNRDLWAFLVHRPVTRTDVFLSKVVAGLVLYTLTVGLPLLVLVVAARVPGHVAAPFEWLMVVPLVGSFLVGIAAYFAGVLTGWRQARWYASRGLGLGLVLVPGLVVFGDLVWWKSLLVVVVVIGTAASAAWGAGQMGGGYQGQPAAGKTTLVFTMALGCFLVLGVAIGVLEWFQGLPAMTTVRQSGYQMTGNGAIYKVTREGARIVGIEDLEGHPLMDPATGKPIEQGEFRKRVAYGPGLTTPAMPMPWRGAYRQEAAFFTLLNVTDKTLWYLDRHGQLVGFDGPSRKCIRSPASAGTNQDASEERFLVPGGSMLFYNYYRPQILRYLPTARAIFALDCQQRTLRRLLTLTNETVLRFEDQPGNDQPGSTPSFVFVTDKAVYHIDHEGHIIFRVPIDPSYQSLPDIAVSNLRPDVAATNAFAIWFGPTGQGSVEAGKTPTKVVWVGPAGQWETAARELPALPPQVDPVAQRRWSDQIFDATVPPIIGLVALVNASFEGHIKNEMPLAIVCALAGGWLARRYAFELNATIGWMAFILVAGLPGLMAFGCVQEWPARVTCPHCQKRRVVDHETCEHCGAPFPPAEKNGTEIFEALSNELVSD